MRYEILNTKGEVENIISSTAEYMQQHYRPEQYRESAQSPGTREPAPESCSPAQGLVALYALHGVTEKAVSDAIASIPDPTTRYTAQIAFSRATEWRRSSATMQQLSAMLNLTDVDLDALFAFAVNVEV